MTNAIELPPPTPDEEAFTPETLRAALLESQTRDRVSMRPDFCQELGGDRAPGPLHHFVGERRLFALQLYLLLLCVASAKPWDKAMSATSWALALDRANAGAASTVSRNWAWLTEKKLIRTERRGRDLHVFRLHESGSGAEFTKPKGNFFYFRFAYFTQGWHEELSLGGTVALLIALSMSRHKPWFTLPTERAYAWYDISPDTLRRGLDELRDHGLLKVHQRSVRNHRARGGTTRVNEYALLGDFITPQPISAKDRP